MHNFFIGLFALASAPFIIFVLLLIVAAVVVDKINKRRDH